MRAVLRLAAVTWPLPYTLIFGRSAAALEITRVHERVHVRQYERWGIAQVPTYLTISVFLYLRGRDGYRENPFEIEAYAVDTPGLK
jgi:hypothetical protein